MARSSASSARPTARLLALRPLAWHGRSVRYLIVLPAFVGGRIGTGLRDLYVNVALAKDDSIRQAPKLEWKDAEPVAKAELATAAQSSVGLSRAEAVLEPPPPPS